MIRILTLLACLLLPAATLLAQTADNSIIDSNQQDCIRGIKKAILSHADEFCDSVPDSVGLTYYIHFIINADSNHITLIEPLVPMDSTKKALVTRCIYKSTDGKWAPKKETREYVLPIFFTNLGNREHHLQKVNVKYFTEDDLVKWPPSLHCVLLRPIIINIDWVA
jgi:hypothetical protein